MSMMHLSDIEIQEYLDTKTNKEQVEKHIAGCKKCAVSVTDYKSFYSVLSKEEPVALSVEFIAHTMEAVRNKKVVLGNDRGFYLYSIVSFISAFLLLKYYVGVDFSFMTIELSYIQNMFRDWSIVNSAAHYYKTSASTVNILLFAGLVLLFYALVDSIMSRKSESTMSGLSI